MAKLCFLIAPIGDQNTPTRAKSDLLLKEVVAPAVNECGYEALRADQISEPGIITSQIISHVVSDSLVIADLTDHNPNVFYELAIRHATRRPVLQMIQDGQRIPFDLAQARTIFYSLATTEGIAAARQAVKAQIHAIERIGPRFDNPVPAALSLQNPDVFVYETAEDAYRVIPEVIREHDRPGDREFYLAAFHGQTGRERTNSYEDAKNNLYAEFDSLHLKCVLASGSDRWLMKEVFNILSQPLLDKKMKLLEATKNADGFELRSFCKPRGIPMLSPLIIGSDNVFWGLEDGKYRRVRRIIRVVDAKAAALAKEFFVQSLWNHEDIFRLRSELEINYSEIDRLRVTIHALEQ